MSAHDWVPKNSTSSQWLQSLDAKTLGATSLDVPRNRVIIIDMVVRVELPTELEAAIRQNIAGDLNDYAREALAVQMYRDGKLTHGQLQLFLNVSSYRADEILKIHGGVDEMTVDELAAQVSASRSIRRAR